MRVGKIFVDIVVWMKRGISDESVKEKETYSERRDSQVSLAKRCSPLPSSLKKTFMRWNHTEVKITPWRISVWCFSLGVDSTVFSSIMSKSCIDQKCIHICSSGLHYLFKVNKVLP